MRLTLQTEDLACLFKRDKDGRYTRELSVEDLARHYAIKMIETDLVIYRLTKAGIPGNFIENTYNITNTYINTLLPKFNMSRISLKNLRAIDKVLAERIKKSYYNINNLSYITKLLRMKDYTVIYSVLRNELKENPQIPEDLDRFL